MVQGMSASDVNMSLEKFSDEISKLSKDLGFTYYCFCHLKAPTTGHHTNEEERYSVISLLVVEQ